MLFVYLEVFVLRENFEGGMVVQGAQVRNGQGRRRRNAIENKHEM